MNGGGVCDTVMDRTEVTGKGRRGGWDREMTPAGLGTVKKHAFRISLFLLYNQCKYLPLFNYIIYIYTVKSTLFSCR